MHDKKLLFFAACTVCLSSIAAPADSDLQQDAPRQHMLHGGVEYTTELQTNFSGDYNFINLLRLSADLRLGRGFTFRASTVSTAKTRDESITDDQLDFSNLYVDNTALALALGGVEWSPNEHHTLFVGVHTMNEDCFASEVTSLFTTSSCGITPTVSMNYDIANFPVASLGMHYKYSADRWGLVATLYNGRGYGRFSGRENVFRFCPKDDGLFGVLQGELKPHGSHYFLGLAAHYGQLGTLPERRLRPTLWAYGEQRAGERLKILAGYSHAFDTPNYEGLGACSDFVGLGAKCDISRAELGLFTQYARFSGEDRAVPAEWTAELTCKVALTDHIYVQPTLHYIKNKDVNTPVGLLRLGIAY